MAQWDFLSVILLMAALGPTLISAEGVSISSSSSGVIDALENDTTSIWCDIHSFLLGAEALTWTITTNTNRTLHLGTCYEGSNQCSSPYNDTYMQLHQSYSYIILKWDVLQRNNSGKLSCSVTFDDNTTESDDTVLNIYHLPKVDSCSFETINHNWSAVLFCDVYHAFSTADIYRFQVHEAYLLNVETDETSNRAWECLHVSSSRSLELNTPNMVSWDYMFLGNSENSSDLRKCVHHGPVSYRHSLTSYRNTTDNKQYYRGRLVYSWRLFLFPADDWIVRVSACVGSIVGACTSLDRKVSSISVPSTPRHSCTDATYIPETGGTGCVCTADDLGSPAGRLVWMRGNTTIVTGGYGVSQLLLPAQSMTRDQEGTQVVCQLDWIEPKQALLPLNIAYGPDSVDLRVSQQYDANNKLLILVDCQVRGLNPKSPDMVQWGGPCQGQRGFTCTLDPQQTEVQDQTVTCRVTNPANNGHSAKAAQMVETVTMPVPEKAAGSSSDHVKWAAIGGAVMLGVVVVITLLVVVVVWTCRRGHPCSGPVYDSTLPKGRQQSQQSNNSGADTHHYEVINTKRNKGRGPRPEPNSDHVYENTGFSEQQGHM